MESTETRVIQVNRRGKIVECTQKKRNGKWVFSCKEDAKPPGKKKEPKEGSDLMEGLFDV